MVPQRRIRVLVAVGLALAMLAASAVWSNLEERTARALPECPEAPPIVIDPGHGGIDGGTNVPGMLEKDVVLDVALRTRKYLERYKIPVVMTREQDTALGGTFDGGHLRRDLNYRVRVANHCKAAFMLSLHVNSTRDATERGMIIFYQPSRAGRDAAYVFDDILRRWPLHERKEVPHPRSDFAVLKTKAPAVLVELGFITSAQDRERLGDEVYREKLAQALSSGCAAIYQKWMKHGSP
ncbi:MAG TPA: N-acetylmuramoyl-L-alanine amidase [Symbiobacteriaceae bacterium]|nr:N-acetylmuramoyl-L-alanine amidase [Symbiobacteriaceae bacterium]